MVLAVVSSIFRELAEGRYIPNGGFLEDIVIEDPALCTTSHTSDAPGDILSDELDTVIDKNEQLLDIPVVHAEEDADSLHGDSKNDDLGEMAADMAKLNVSVSVSAEEQNEVRGHVAQSNEIDALLDKCLLQALHTTVKDKDLPLSGSILWYLTFSFLFIPIMLPTKLLYLEHRN